MPVSPPGLRRRAWHGAGSGLSLLLERGLAVAVLTLAQGAPAAGQPGLLELDPDVLAVRRVFDGYKTALMSADGASARRLVDQATLDYYQRVKDLALEADAETMKGETFINRLLVVTLRQELAPEVLADMEFEDLVVHAVSRGWIGQEAVEQIEMGRVKVQGDDATAEARIAGRDDVAQDPTAAGGLAALSYRFTREDGQWKFRFSTLVESLNETVSQLSAQLGTQEDDLIFTLVEALSGKPVLPEIWERP